MKMIDRWWPRGIRVSPSIPRAESRCKEEEGGDGVGGGRRNWGKGVGVGGHRWRG